MQKMPEALGTDHKCGRRLLGGWWWLIESKLVFGQMAAPVPEIMDDSLYIASSESTTSACFINPSHQSASLYVYPFIVAMQGPVKFIHSFISRQRLGESILENSTLQTRPLVREGAIK
jgi:hypothetical protein